MHALVIPGLVTVATAALLAAAVSRAGAQESQIEVHAMLQRTDQSHQRSQ